MTQADVRTALEWDGGSWKPVAANAALAAAAAAGGSKVAAEEGGSDAMAEPAASKPQRGKKEAQPKPAPYQVSAHSHADVYTHSEISGPVLVRCFSPNSMDQCTPILSTYTARSAGLPGCKSTLVIGSTPVV